MTGATPKLTPAELYAGARLNLIAIFRAIPEERLDDIVPATKLWTARDVAAHLVGVCEDVGSGNLPTAGTFPVWTQAQVERRKGWAADDLIEAWDELLIRINQRFEAGTATETPSIDVATHEQDLRGFLAQPGGRDAPAYRFGVAAFRSRFLGKVAELALPVLAVETEAGRWTSAEAEPQATLRIPAFELFRACAGRRSPAQMAAYEWSIDDPAPFIELMPIFGPRQVPLVE